MANIVITLANQTELNASYIEEALIIENRKRRVTIRFKESEGYSIDEIATLCTAENLTSITVTGTVNKTITGITVVESLGWRLSEYDNGADLTLTLTEV